MPTWKRNIFVNAIKARMETEARTAEDLITEYTKLADVEKAEILAVIQEG